MKLRIIFFIILLCIISGCSRQVIDFENDSEVIINSSFENITEEISEEEVLEIPQIENLGIDFEDLTLDTFTYPWGEKLEYQKIWVDYGDSVKENKMLEPQPVFVAPLGTKVKALTSGIVYDVKMLYSGDYTVMIQKEIGDKYTYEHEHVINVTVNIGDAVIAGQEIAQVSDYNEWLRGNGYGILDIGILSSSENGRPMHHCPIMYLNESLKDDFFNKIKDIYSRTEAYHNNYSMYDEENYAMPGCIISEPIVE